MKKLILLVGRTGAGKDTIARTYTAKYDNVAVVASYTDAPIRSDQTQGVEHTFCTREEMNNILKNSGVVAYTEINGNRYCVTKEYLDKLFETYDTVIYLIDPKGVESLTYNRPEILRRVVYVYTSDELRKSRSANRKNFDFDARDLAEYTQFTNFVHNGQIDLVLKNNNNSVDHVVRELHNYLSSF